MNKTTMYHTEIHDPNGQDDVILKTELKCKTVTNIWKIRIRN